MRARISTRVRAMAARSPWLVLVSSVILAGLMALLAAQVSRWVDDAANYYTYAVVLEVRDAPDASDPPTAGDSAHTPAPALAVRYVDASGALQGLDVPRTVSVPQPLTEEWLEQPQVGDTVPVRVGRADAGQVEMIMSHPAPTIFHSDAVWMMVAGAATAALIAAATWMLYRARYERPGLGTEFYGWSGRQQLPSK